MYIHKPTGRYPVSEHEIRSLHPNTRFPSPFIAPDEYAPVFPAPQPEHSRVTHACREVEPVLTSKGHYEQAWEVVVLDEETVAANMAREVERITKEVTDSTQARLDAWARTRNYDGILSLCTYATSSVARFAMEGQRGVDNRDVTWATLYAIMDEVQSGTRPMPGGFADVEPDLPALDRKSVV